MGNHNERDTMNNVILIGNITRDIELKYMPSGDAIATTGIATNRKFKKKDGSQGEEVMFIDLTFFGRNAEIANQYVKRGSMLAIEGALKLDSWDDKNGGGKRSKHTVRVESMKMIGGKSDEPKQERQPTTYSGNTPVYDNRTQSMPEFDIDLEEIPF